MYNQEKERLAHLTILLCYTIFVGVLTVESFLMNWDMSAILLLLMGVGISWVLHITGQLSAEIRLWLYFVLSMLTFFFYGVHETSMYDLAPVMVLVIIMYSVTENINITKCCVLTYYIIMVYDLLFVCRGSLELSALVITRTMLHFAVVGIAGYMVNLILRRRAAENKGIEAKVLELEDINHRTEQFLTNVSHELRTPINAVTGITTVMMKNEEDPHKKKDILAVQNAGRRLFGQIEDILDYTELDAGRIKISEENYMLSSIINDIIAEERMRDKESNLEIIFDIDASVPSVLSGDGRKIKKIIKHLLDNSIKFTKKGGVCVRIYAMEKPYGVNLCIHVRDTGIGIEKEQLERLQEKFYQTKKGRIRKDGGLGLGLSIVYGLTTAMEGFMRIESKMGTGTEVMISIPQKISDETSCMSVTNRAELCLACYLKSEKYEVPEVRDYFDSAIAHIIQGLDLSLHRISSREELKRLISLYRLTHLFIGQAEYMEDEAYYEELTMQMKVVVVADYNYSLSSESKVKIVKKPFYSLSIVNLLNYGEEKQEEWYLERRMICPGIKALVVDDEPMNLMVAEGIFKQYQMEVTTAESGMEAVELCKKETFDLIFLDHMMPEMDGVETLKLLRKLSANPGETLTVIAFTANAVSGAREMFRQEGFDGFVSKPIEEVELERVLKNVLPRTAIIYEDENEGDENNISSQQPNMERFLCLEKADIHTHSGLNYCRGDEAFYFELLTKFAQEADKKSAEINRFFEEEDCENYRIRVHAMKSTSKMIGADKFSAMARAAEDAAKDHNMNYIKEHHEELLMAYWDVVNSIKEALGIQQAVDSKENCVEITKEELLEQLRELQTGLETFETEKAEQIIEKLSTALYNNVVIADMLSDVRQDVENFECGEAFSKIEALIAKVEGGEV